MLCRLLRALRDSVVNLLFSQLFNRLPQRGAGWELAGAVVTSQGIDDRAKLRSMCGVRAHADIDGTPRAIALLGICQGTPVADG